MGRENKMHWDNWQPRRVSDEGRKNGEEMKSEGKGKRVALTSELQIATRDAPSSLRGHIQMTSVLRGGGGLANF